MENYVLRHGRKLIIFWICLIVSISLVIGYFAITYLRQTEGSGLLRSVDITREVVNPPADASEGSQPVKVKTGIYVTRISELKIKDSYWIVDFYVWFLWKGDEFPDPGKSIEIIGGEIIKNEIAVSSQNGDEHYSSYIVQAKITKNFDVRRFPADSHILTITLEDTFRDSYLFQYIVESSEIAPDVTVLGYTISQPKAWTAQHTYYSTFGNPDTPATQKAVYSQFVYGIPIERPDWGYYLKMFQGLFAAIVLALVLFLTPPSEKSDRLALGVGSFFAAIANTYFAANVLPDSGVMALMDIINGIGYIMILMIVISSVLSAYVYEVDKRLAVLMDRLSLITFLICYIALNIILPASTLW